MSKEKKERFYQFKSPISIAKWASAAIYVSMGLTLINIFVSLIYGDFSSEINEITLSSLIESMSTFDKTTMAVDLIAMACYFVWVYRTVSNTRSFGPNNITMTPGWSVAWYFIPIVNFYGPYQEMQKIWKVSQNPRNWEREFSSPLIKYWWFTFLVIFICPRVLSAIDGTISQSTLQVFFVLLGVVGIIYSSLQVQMIKKISKIQLSTFNNLATNNDLLMA